MSGRASKRGFAARPGDVESWIKASDAPPRRMDDGAAFTARPTIDVTPTLRGRIKVAAFQRGVIATDRPPHCFPTIMKTGLHTPYRSIRFFYKILSPMLSWCQARTASCLSCRPVESGKEPR